MCNINKTIKNYSISLKYDLRPIDKNHPLHEHISKKVNLGNGETTDTYLKYAGVVFDKNTKNFHIFPEKANKCNALVKEYSKISVELKKKLQKDCKVTIGTGEFKLLYNIENLCTIPEKEKFKKGEADIYKYVKIKANEIEYKIKFMRYMYDKEGNIGCTMRAIQFHKDHGYINKGKDNEFDICYPSTDEDGDFRTNNAGNICYNPPVVFPAANSENYNEQITKIANCFIKFIRKYNNSNSK